jgi:bifunctional non-homologous end joining protein LigD
VSTPLKWSEVRKGMDPSRFTIKTVPKRIEKFGDLWEPVLGEGIHLGKCLERLQVSTCS